MSSVASIGPAAFIYREDQLFSTWLYFAIAVAAAALSIAPAEWLPFRDVAPQFWGISSIGAIFSILLFLFVVFRLKMTIVATPSSIQVWFGWLPGFRQTISVADVTRVEAVRFRPLRDHYGWGVRTGRSGERVLSARGDAGVRLHLSNGSSIVIGSQRAEEFALCLQSVLRP